MKISCALSNNIRKAQIVFCLLTGNVFIDSAVAESLSEKVNKESSTEVTVNNPIKQKARLQATHSHAPLTLPLRYGNLGWYTVPLNIGNQTLNVIVDTGSSNLNLVGDAALCDQCSVAGFPNSRLTPDAAQKPTPNYFVMEYGSTSGILRQYQGTVGFANLTQIPYVYSVFITNPANPSILGLAYQTLASPEGLPPPSFIGQWLAAGNYRKRFTLTLCGAKGNSNMIVGGQPTGLDPKKILYTPIARKGYYSVLMRGIVDKKTQKYVVNFGSSYVNQEAVVDSGTPGNIMLPQSAVTAMIQYTRQTIGKALDAKIPAPFWHDSQCIAFTPAMLAQFPTYQVALLKWGHPQQSILVDLPPESYLSSDYCQHGMRTFAFYSTGGVQFPSPFIMKRLRSVGLVTSKILGTPLFQGKSVIFDRGWNYNVTRHYDAKIGFVDAGAQCSTSG